MAKFTVTYKSPDGPYECISEAKHEIPAGDVERVCDKFGMGEYLTIELDTETLTCRIVPERWSKMRSEEHYAELNAEWKQKQDDEQAEKDAFEKALKEAEEEAKKNGTPPEQLARVQDMSLGAASWVDDEGSVHTPIVSKPRYEKVSSRL